MNSTRTLPIKIIGTLTMCLGVMLATPAKAHAYADPGTGAFVYQAAYAAFLGGAYYFRKFMDRIFRKRK